LNGLQAPVQLALGLVARLSVTQMRRARALVQEQIHL
jgi:hypothetical protein